MKDHEKNNMESHLSMVVREMCAMKNENKKQVARLEGELDMTKNEMGLLRAELTDYRRTNELSRYLRNEMDKVFFSMRTLDTRLQEEKNLLGVVLQDEMAAFDSSYRLIDGKLNYFNKEARRKVQEVIERCTGLVSEYGNLEIEDLFLQILNRFDEEDNGEGGVDVTEETKERLHLSVFVAEHKNLLGKLHLELANIHAAFHMSTYEERFRAMQDNLPMNTKVQTQDGYFLIKVEVLDCFEGEWSIQILTKKTMFSEFNKEKYEDLLVKKHASMISIFLGDGLFTYDVPCINVCNPRKFHKLILPTIQRNDFAFRINFTTLATSNLIVDGCLVLRINEVPKMQLDYSFFKRTGSASSK